MAKLEREPNNSINFIGGFDGYTVGNHARNQAHLRDLMGVEYTILGRQQRRVGHPDGRRVPHV